MLRKNVDDLYKFGKKGDWAFMDNKTYLAIRYGESSFTGTVIVPVSNANKNGWKWNGSEDNPSLEPSILVPEKDGFTEGWHGFLTDGKLITL